MKDKQEKWEQRTKREAETNSERKGMVDEARSKRRRKRSGGQGKEKKELWRSW